RDHPAGPGRVVRPVVLLQRGGRAGRAGADSHRHRDLGLQGSAVEPLPEPAQPRHGDDHRPQRLRAGILHAAKVSGQTRLVASGSAMRIARQLYAQMIEQARAEAPNECCGMIASQDGEAVRVYPTENAAASPLRYEIDGAEQIRIYNEIEDAGLELGAIYHSHTRT